MTLQRNQRTKTLDMKWNPKEITLREGKSDQKPYKFQSHLILEMMRENGKI